MTSRSNRPFPGVERRTSQTAQATLVTYSFAPGAGFPRHAHPEEQITVVLCGQAEFEVDDTTREICADQLVVVPGSVPHALKAGPDGARVLAVIVPRRGDPDAYTLSHAIRR